MFNSLNKRFKIVFHLKNLIADLFCKIFLLTFPNKWASLISERINQLNFNVYIKNKPLSLISNSDLLLYRSKTFHTKESETNNWIEKMPSDGVFFDVGANVGVFSVLASQFCKTVYAFEPVSLNYAILNQNLMRNGLDKNVFAYCIAIGEATVFDSMRLSSQIVGSAHHSFGVDLNAAHQQFTPVFKQACLSMSLDDLIYKSNFECPTYLKVDVDGNEHLVIKGADRLLKDLRLKSILIELNKSLKLDQDLVSLILGYGFVLTEKGEESEFNGTRIGNLIFFRQY